MGRRFGAIVVGSALAWLAALPVARGQEPGGTEKKAVAQVLFDEARKLTEEGDYETACAKFQESHRLDPSMGTKFYLADCLEHIGKIASAWGYYVEVADAARAAGQKDREAYARERADALKPKLPTLVVAVPATARGAQGLVVKRDGIVVGAAQWGTAIPVDPGEHVVTATAPGKKPWEARVTAVDAGQPVTVDVPLLENATGDQRDQPPPPPGTTTPSSGSGQLIAGIAVGVAGLAGIGVGTFFGLSAMSKQDESNADGHCDAQNRCDDTGLALRSDAIGAATVSTIGFIAGGVALAGGAVLILTAPSAPAKVVVGPGSVTVLGKF